MENKENDNITENRANAKRPSKVRDIFTDRIVGVISGACIPLILLFVPIINKKLDQDTEIQKLQIEAQARVAWLTEKLSDCQRAARRRP